MSNPIVELVEWLKSQEDDIQVDIAFLMSGFNPAFGISNLSLEASEILEYFYARILEFSGSDIQNTGFIVAFKANFNFLFLKQRGTDEGWEKPKRLFQSVLDSKDPNLPAGMKETASKSLMELPARQEKWKAVCRSWQELISGALSDQAIERWDTENLLSR